jgi:hypothetical protein
MLLCRIQRCGMLFLNSISYTATFLFTFCRYPSTDYMRAVSSSSLANGVGRSIGSMEDFLGFPACFIIKFQLPIW